MALDRIAPPILIINGLPITFPVGCFMGNVTKTCQSAIIVDGTTGDNQFFLLGSSMASVENKMTDIVRATTLSVRYSINFSVENQGAGLAFTDLLIPALDVAYKALTIPCQFIYDGFYIAWGYLEDYSATKNPTENKLDYSLNIIENVWRLISNENSSSLYMQSENIPESTIRSVG